MKKSSHSRAPRCFVIAGPNGAGKTTFAREFLPVYAGDIHFVNVDLIAGGLSPLRPELAAMTAGRLFLSELDRLAKAQVDFAFESTLSGLAYAGRLRRWKTAGYRIEMAFLQLTSPQLALRRIAARVKQGGQTCRRPTSCVDSSVDGKISNLFIAGLRKPGRSTIILEPARNLSNEAHDQSQSQQRSCDALQKGRERPDPCRQDRTQGGPHARYTGLLHSRRQDHRRETLASRFALS
ncbi:MAG TPA: hypothetical protein VK785_02295 [Opitutaceae bacterium]|jgi:hypothetical protein|nr:hypothetical protein [Opitutaceae bacterium]